MWRDSTSTSRLLWIVIWLLLFPTLAAYGDERVVARVILNEEEKETYFLIFMADGDVLFPGPVLKEIGFKTIPPGIEKEGTLYVSLRSLSPQVQFRFDEKTVTVRVTVDPQLLEPTVMDFSRQQSPTYHRDLMNSAFLNYSVISTNSTNVQTLAAQSEVGIRIKEYLALSGFSYAKTTTTQRSVRGLTSVIRDYPDSQVRTVMGDASAFSGPLGSGAIIGGLSISRNFSLMPYFQRIPGLNYAGLLTTPSEVEVYVNGQLTKREHFGPGPFSLTNLPGTLGAGNTTVVIRDAFQNEQRIVNPYYLSSALLQPHLHEYSYNVGFRRTALQESFAYQEPVLLFSHRVGLSETLTAGFRGEANHQLINGGPLATFLLGRWGEVTTTGAISQEQGQTGYAAFGTYTYIRSGFSVRTSVQNLSRAYSNLSLDTIHAKPRLQWQGSLGYNFPFLGSLSATYTTASFYGQPTFEAVSLFYQRPVFTNFYFQASAIRTLAPTPATEIFCGLTFFLGSYHSGTVGVQSSPDHTLSETATFQKNAPRGPGWAYRFQGSRTEDTLAGNDVSTDDLVQYQGNHGVYGVGYRRVQGQDQDSVDLRMAGSVAFVDRGVYFSRPIPDSFALVKVGSLKNVDVSYSNLSAGRTNAKGELLVPDLISYYENQLSIEDTDVAINYNLANVRKIATPWFRGGIVARFDATKVQGFVGHVFIREKGESKPAEYGNLVLSVPDQPPVTAVVGEGGEFYVENLQPGKVPVRVEWQQKICRFDIMIPGSEDLMVDLGVLTCEMH